MTDEDLIALATSVIRPYWVKDRQFGDVGAAVLDMRGRSYAGVCVDTPGWGLCAERSAMAAMITAGEYRIAKVVAVWRDTRTQEPAVLPPCGICREFMRAIDEGNLNACVLLGRGKSASLRELLPRHEWPEADGTR